MAISLSKLAARLSSRQRTALSVAMVLVLAALGLVALTHMLREVRLSDVRHAWHAMPTRALLAAAALTAVSYVTLTLYDVMALRTIGRPLPYRTAALASFTSYTLSHNLGLALLTGGSARFRIYNAAGLSAGEIARVVMVASATFWGGILVLASAMLAVRPEVATDILPLSADMLRVAGMAVLLLVVGLLAWAGRKGRQLSLRGMKMPVPPAPVILAQIGISTVDLLAASAALFVLVPGAALGTWPVFFIGYTLAIIAVLVTHVPGGVGVFEAVMLAALPDTSQPELLAALLAYRLIYYIAPLLIAIALILIQEGWRRREPIARTIDGVRSVVSSLAPAMSAALVFFGGCVLLVSGSLPTVPGRANLLSDFVPLPVTEISHLAGSLVGAALLVLSAGLYRRLDGAFWLTRLLLLAGALFSLLKGLDYEEASIMILIASALQWTRAAFYRRTHFLAEAFTPGWLATVGVVLALSIWIGFFAYKHVEYQDDLWWQFAVRGDASRFLRASLGVAVLLGVIAFWHLFRPARPYRGVTSDGAAVPPQAIAMARRADVNLALVGDKRFLVAESGRAFLMYQVRGHSWIVMGDPVGDESEWADLLWTLRERVDAAQGRLLLYQISVDALPLAIELGLQVTKYGEEAQVDLAQFTLDGPAAKSLRHAERRATREGATFDIVPASETGGVMAELAQVSGQWMTSKRQREKGFSVGRFDPAYIALFDCAVIRQEGRIIAFANIWTTHDRSELSVDLMRHADEMPYGTMDFLFIRLMQWGKEQGYARFNLGMAPLAGLEARRLASIWSRLGALIYQHGNAFYGFEGLRAYKEKFAPEWVGRYVAGPQGLAFARTLMDLQSLIGGPQRE
ncbi:MAG: bifunctional lysylphosphatidylglycerol flippase/synthetase MprF [Sphingobium sp.]|uniref:bifunctional lysylphosphatidylglycerol flippase/synthetase MprF n=1 Tax=Sphingobium sp. TaxID=1912891 RepID=UPI000DB5D4B9|nr:bifunctional lysylphosphatidylglycerol flippase/synthetase MprF [Sphingobium sp.]PZU13126.1 MAG: bifunctional lysylphosphatidylglycerol flippase/synthetase MprF [Sphingobium sp.]